MEAIKLEVAVDSEFLKQVVERLQGTEKVFTEILLERERQDQQWGGPNHDDSHCGWGWCIFIAHQNNAAHAKALNMSMGHNDVEHVSWRDRMVRIAALAVAAIESHDRVCALPPEVESE